MGKLFKIEMKKLSKSTAMRVMLIVAASISLLNVIIYGFADNMASELLAILGKADGYHIMKSLICDDSDIMLMVVILMAVLVGGDFSARTLQTQIAAGFGRFEIIISRFLSTMVAYVILQAIYVGITGIGSTILFGFGSAVSGEMIGELLLDIVLSLLLAMTMLSIYMLFAFLLKSTGATIGVCLPTMLMGVSIINFISGVSRVMRDVMSFTPFGQQMALSDGGLIYTQELDPVKFILVCVVWLAGFISLTFLSFRNAELK